MPFRCFLKDPHSEHINTAGLIAMLALQPQGISEGRGDG